MPAPPLIMVPPPTTPGMPFPFSGEGSVQQSRQHDASLNAYTRRLNYIEASDPPAAEALASLLSDQPALDIIQTPNGTAKAGWWIPQGQIDATAPDSEKAQGDASESAHAKDQASSVSPPRQALFQTR